MTAFRYFYSRKCPTGGRQTHTSADDNIDNGNNCRSLLGPGLKSVQLQ